MAKSKPDGFRASFLEIVHLFADTLEPTDIKLNRHRSGCIQSFIAIDIIVLH